MDLLAQIELNTSKGPDYAADAVMTAIENPQVRLIAHYLPQFHPIPENDEWWGKGFTEWTNVTKAIPRFEGHYQPQLPSGLGFYDLRVPNTLIQQAQLARKYGIAGFCFYRYWFNGKTLLETPLNIFLANPQIDIGFCLNWANENWTRRWNGLDKEILIAQEHSPEDDIRFAESLLPYFDDPRYIRINGRPLLMLYRPGVLPDAKATVERWRSYFAKAGVANPYIVMAQAYDDTDPRKYGIDAAAGFPPHNTGSFHFKMNSSLNYFHNGNQGSVVSYQSVAATMLRNNPLEFKLMPGVCTAWDNEARRPNRGNCLAGSTPARYGAWLKSACDAAATAESPDERIVFINAWNEWAEGAHLEPDRYFGYAYLAETLKTLRRLNIDLASPQIRRPYEVIQAEFRGPGRSHNDHLAVRAMRRLTNKGADYAEKIARGLRR